MSQHNLHNPNTEPDWLATLNSAQRNAVCRGAGAHGKYQCGPLLVVAGAGTGKTATRCHRVAWLVHHHESPVASLLRELF